MCTKVKRAHISKVPLTKCLTRIYIYILISRAAHAHKSSIDHTFLPLPMHDAQFFLRWRESRNLFVKWKKKRKEKRKENRSLVSIYILKMGQTCQYQMLPIFYFIPKNWSNREKKMKKTKNKAVEKKKSRMWWNMSNKCLFIRRIWGAAQNVTEARFTLCRICLWHIPCAQNIPGNVLVIHTVILLIAPGRSWFEIGVMTCFLPALESCCAKRIEETSMLGNKMCQLSQ